MTTIYDKEVDILNIKFVEQSDYRVSDSQEQNGFIFDFDANGDVIGIEILHASTTINNFKQLINE